MTSKNLINIKKLIWKAYIAGDEDQLRRIFINLIALRKLFWKKEKKCLI